MTPSKKAEEKKEIELTPRQMLVMPFKEKTIEWRVQSCGIAYDKPWVMVLAYVEARALQDRLDRVFGFDGWKTHYRFEEKGIICELSVLTEHGWITKEDGAVETDVEAFKGGISSAFKRVCASGFGMGRYLYKLDTNFAESTTEKPSSMKGIRKAKTKDGKLIYWEVPFLPDWALPEFPVWSAGDVFAD